jgi:hypothetical protein
MPHDALAVLTPDEMPRANVHAAITWHRGPSDGGFADDVGLPDLAPT